ncbi:MAG: transcriptional repressor [Bacteroidia bacterium]|nr:transcriptional repressor [Bacteroidia bacterium]MDW8088330.1 transcriptional repressor [Bacteroidia bacterium]
MSSSEAFQQAQKHLEAYLTQQGLRRTAERTHILRAIYEELMHFDAETLHAHLLKKGLKVSRATVYNTLELFLACGLVRRYSFYEGRMIYERSLGRQQHDHLICLDCGFIQEFCDPQVGFVLQGIERLFRMQSVRHDLVIYARCTDAVCPHRPKVYTFAEK